MAQTPHILLPLVLHCRPTGLYWQWQIAASLLAVAAIHSLTSLDFLKCTNAKCWKMHKLFVVDLLDLYCMNLISVRQHAERTICYRKSVCPSLCLSITQVDQSKTVELRVVEFSAYSSPIPLLYYIYAVWFSSRNSDGIPPSGATNEGGSGKRASIVAVLMLSPGGSTS